MPLSLFDDPTPHTTPQKSIVVPGTFPFSLAAHAVLLHQALLPLLPSQSPVMTPGVCLN